MSSTDTLIYYFEKHLSDLHIGSKKCGTMFFNSGSDIQLTEQQKLFAYGGFNYGVRPCTCIVRFSTAVAHSHTSSPKPTINCN